MRMGVLRRLWMGLAVWAVVCFAQPLSFVTTPHDFQHKKTKLKRKNLDYLSGCGLILRDRDQAGEIDSEPVELPIGALMLSFQWVSSLPSNGLIIRAQVSNDGRVWSSWFPASDGIQFNPHSNLYMGKPLSGFGQAKYVRYHVDVQPQPAPGVQGCLARINITSATATLPAIQGGQAMNCSVNAGCQPAN
jgi:hypothetical protein